ncbi:hypothetical protein UVI_02062050 [Ustilaginoidea virens]|uniref:Uncharacterized protein n=1 Tax=Ustilaginoidea virens TaxID=1159556 RepID=A0A1B5L4Z2_USTVR|nr:hypothetical protein UVI_02062050 [Ustilaginoidea virens]
MNTQGVKLGCSDPAEAQRILGNGFDLGGGRIVITQTFSTPGQARTSQLPSTTNDVLPTPNPNSLLLIPVELSNLIPKPAAPTQESNQVAGNGGGGGGGGGGSGGGSGSLNGNPSSSITGAPRTTVVSNGTPTVSVFFTVTVTEKERITETVTATLTLPVATSG